YSSSQLQWSAVSGLLLLLTLGTFADSSADQLNNTIVVHTPLQNYDQPTLRDYEECQMNRDHCLDVCSEDEKCTSECPVCPELYSKPLMVQGVNDTDVVAPPQTPANTTNIIRLTNEIRNIIKHEIQQRNEVNVQVQQNVSQMGGRFGLGHSDQGPCCYVVRLDRKCETEPSDNCREKSRQRVCGERCQARVMLAKRVVQCDATDPTNCHETIEYTPRRRRSHHKVSSESEPCRYLGNNWPYLSCGQSSGQSLENQRRKRSVCQQCVNIPYGYVLLNGLPTHCAGCFQMNMPLYGAPFAFNPYMPYPPYGSFPPNNYITNNDKVNNGAGSNGDNDLGISGSGDDEWILCDDDDIEKCMEEKDKGREPGPPAHQEQAPGAGEDYSSEPEYGVPAQRRRRRRHNRRNFVRSAYSKRKHN
ncbi:hypothetical protein KR009_011686, partial [Drosophila setifemur]